jgi:hypothetical protein
MVFEQAENLPESTLDLIGYCRYRLKLAASNIGCYQL